MNWLECDECHVGCKPHEDWCSHAQPNIAPPVVARGERYLQREDAWLRGHSTTPGRVSLRIRGQA